MGGKAAVTAGLVTGVVAGGALLAGVLLLTPAQPAPTRPPVVDPLVTARPTAPPSAPASASPGSVAPSAVTASGSPGSGSPASSGSPGPSGSPAAGSPSPGTTAFRVGQPAPPLTVARLGGGEVSLTGLRGKPVWVNFMATWCPPCRDELPLMNGFAARYADAGLVVVAIDVREPDAAVNAFVRSLNVTFPVGLDRDGTAQSDWGAFALPVHFWIDPGGVIRDGALGGIGPDVMARGLQTILPGVTVTP